MTIFIGLSRLILALTLGAAGLIKLSDPAGTRQMLREFGVPRALRPLALLGLPLLELGLAAMLLLPGTAWWGAVGSQLLLVSFTGAIGWQLRCGRRPACRCFGQLGASPIGPRTLVRNTVLVVLAALLVLGGPDQTNASLLGWLDALTPAERTSGLLGLLVAGLLGAIAWLQLQMLRQQGRILLRLDSLETRLSDLEDGHPEHSAQERRGLPVGSPAPEIELPDLMGTIWSRQSLQRSGEALLLLFMDPHCGPCHSLLPELPEWARTLAPAARVVVISRGTVEEHHGLLPDETILTLLQRDYEVASAYQSWGTPGAVFVRADGALGSRVAAGAQTIRDLVARLPERLSTPRGVESGAALSSH